MASLPVGGYLLGLGRPVIVTFEQGRVRATIWTWVATRVGGRGKGPRKAKQRAFPGKVGLATHDERMPSPLSVLIRPYPPGCQ